MIIFSLIAGVERSQNAHLTYNEALGKAQNFCAYQERCQKEVREKLNSWAVYGDEREQIIVDLIQGKYLNEERFAKAFAGGKFRVKKWGRVKIVRELRQRDISDYCIKQGLAEIDEGHYLETLQSLLQKKNALLKDKNQFTRKSKLAKYLIGKGYESNLVWDQIREGHYLE